MTTDASGPNKALVRRFLAVYGEGDCAAALDLVSEDAVWSLHASPGHFRFGGRWEGKARVHEGLAIIAADYAIHRYEVIQIVAEGDTVWTTSRLTVTHRMTDRLVSFEIAGRWKIRDGRIVEVTEYFDSAFVLNQQGDVPAEIRRRLRE